MGDIGKWTAGMDTKMNDFKIELEGEKVARLKLERDVREKNVIIHGMEDPALDPDSLENQAIEFLNKELAISLGKRDIDRVIRLGSKEVKSCPVKVQLASMRVKNLIVRNRPTLKGTKKAVNDDIPKELRELIHEARFKKKKRDRNALSPEDPGSQSVQQRMRAN